MRSFNRGNRGGVAGEWEDLFRKSGVRVDLLDAAKSQRSRATLLGNFLAQNIGREVPIEVKGRQGTARLCVVEAGKRQRRYFFEIAWADDSPEEPRPNPEPEPSRPAAPPKPHKSPGKHERGRKPPGSKTNPSKTPSLATKPGRNGSGNAEDW